MIELQPQERKCKNTIELLECTLCGQRALSLNDRRITNSSCSTWNIIHTWTVSSGALLDDIEKSIKTLYLR